MKIHEYNEMMAYLTRPAPQKQNFAIGGGVIQGENLGYRTGFNNPNIEYPYKTKAGKPDYRFGRYKDTGKHFRKVGKEDNVRFIYQEEGESLEDFKLRKTERLTTAVDKTVEARNYIDNWTKNWLDQNLSKYGVKDFEVMLNELSTAWQNEVATGNVPKGKANFSLISSELKLPNITTKRDLKLKPGLTAFNYEGFNFHTNLESKDQMGRTMGQWKKIFYKNKIRTTPGLREKLKDHFDYINEDKRGKYRPGYSSRGIYKPDKDVLYLLSEQDSGLQKNARKLVFNSFDDLAKPYNDFVIKMSNSNWLKHANTIEKELGLVKNSIRRGMVAEQNALKKIFDISSLEKTGLEYSIDHGQGLAAAARSGNKNLMEIALTDLIGTTKALNTHTGLKGFELTRGALIRDIEAGIQAGINVENNIKDLNELTKDAYKLNIEGDIYSIKDGRLTSKPISTATTRTGRFVQYFEKLNKTEKGKALIEKQYGSLENLKNYISKLDIKPNDNQKIILKKINDAPIPGRAKALLLPIVAGVAAITGADLMTGSVQAAEPGQMPQGSPGQLSEDEEGLSLQDKAALGTVAVAGAKPAWKYLAKPAFRAIGSVPVSGYLAGTELSKEDPSYAIAGADLLLPELGKRIPGSGTGIMSKIGRGVLNPFQYLEKLGKYGKLGRIAATGARIPSLMTPLGIGLQGVELVNQAMKEQKRINEMRENDPEAYQEYLAEQEEQAQFSAAEGGRVGYRLGGLANLYKGVKGLQEGAIRKKLIKKYKEAGLKFNEYFRKAYDEAAEIVKNRKLNIVQDAMTKVDIRSDDYIKLMDEQIRLTDYELYKDIKRWDEYRPDLSAKVRARHDPYWAESNFGENYDEVLLSNQAKALKAQSDEINKMYPDKSDTDILVDEIDEMNKANLAELLEGRKKNAYGGRIGFDEGSKPKSPGRRAFLKGITALAALPVVGKFFKLGKVLEAEKYTGPTIEKIKGMPEWFPSLVKKLYTEGTDVTKEMAYKERQIVKRGTLESGDDVDMIYDLDTGNVSIEVRSKGGETSSGSYNQEYGLDYKKGEVIDDVDVPQTGTIDPKTGYTKKLPDEFVVNETELHRSGPEPDDVEFYGNETNVDDAISDLTELEAFAKDKTAKQIHKKKGTKPKDLNPSEPDVDWDDVYNPYD